MLKITFSIIGGMASSFFGEFDMLLFTLIAFVVMDYLTGVMKAILAKKVSSKIGFKGIFKKILIFFMVGVAVSLDNLLDINKLRYLVIVFYILNEGMSIIENANAIGLPIPEKIKNALKDLESKDK